MFESKSFPATPANARRLLEFNRLKNTPVSQEVLDLAARDTVASRLTDKQIYLGDAEQRAMQRVLDWRGRGLLLVDTQEQGFEFASKLCKLRDVDKILIVAATPNFGRWAELIGCEFNEKRLCVYGNMRHKSSANLPRDVKFADVPDTTADVIITNYISTVWHDLLGSWAPDQTIVEEFSSAGTSVSAYKNKEMLTALFREVPSPLFIQNVTGYRQNGALVTADKQPRHQNLLWDLEEVLDWGVWASCGFPGRTILQRTPSATKALQSWGYGSLDAWRAMPLLGVSTELVVTNSGPVIDHQDQRVASHHARGKKDGYSRVLQREYDMLAEQGITAEDLVSRALDGDHIAEDLIKGLRTVQWANAKAGSIKKIIEDVGLFPAHSLIIADNPNLHRALLLSLNFAGYDQASYCAALPAGEERESVLSRFLQVESSLLKPISALIVSLQDLDNKELLHMADNVIFAEWPLDRAIYDVVKEDYAVPNNCRLVQTTLTGTIEEEIRRQVTNL
jgi:hypothetical protein